MKPTPWLVVLLVLNLFSPNAEIAPPLRLEPISPTAKSIVVLQTTDDSSLS